MKELELGYIGMISREIDNDLKVDIPSVLKEMGVTAEWSYQECTLQNEPPYRNIGWELSRELTEIEKIELNIAIGEMYDTWIFIMKI